MIERLRRLRAALRQFVHELRGLPRPLWFLFAGTTVTRAGSLAFPVLTIYLEQERGFPQFNVGVILSIGSVGLLVGNMLGGWLTDSWSRKRTLVLALGLNALGFLGLAGSFGVEWLYALFLFVGYLGSGMYTPAANTAMAATHSQESTSDRSSSMMKASTTPIPSS